MEGRRIPSGDRIFVARGGEIHQAINLLLHKSWVLRTCLLLVFLVQFLLLSGPSC